MFGLWRKPCEILSAIVGRIIAFCRAIFSHFAGSTPMTEQLYQRIHSLNLEQLGRFYKSVWEQNDTAVIRDLILNDRFFLLTQVLDVDVAWHPWVLARCREVEAAPDEHLDLWSRGHFKSTIITFAGVCQYVLRDPNKCVCILSYKSGAAQAFLQQIMTCAVDGARPREIGGKPRRPQSGRAHERRMPRSGRKEPRVRDAKTMKVSQ